MKVFIQQTKSGYFLRVDSFWTKEISDAFDFRSTKKAISFGLNMVKESFCVVEMEEIDLSRAPAPVLCRFLHEHISTTSLQNPGFSQLSP